MIQTLFFFQKMRHEILYKTVGKETLAMTQVDDSGHRILQESTENHWKKSENFPAGILLPQNQQNSPEPAVSGPDCSTWGISSQ